MNEEKMLNVKQTAERLGVSPSMIYKLVNAGQICSVRVGRAIRIPATKVDQLLKSADYPTIQLELPLPSPDASKNSRCHWSKRSAATAELRSAARLVWMQACRCAGVPHDWGLQPVVIDMLYAFNRKSFGYKARDTANALDAIKGTIDGLIDGGMAPDDSSHWVEWGSLKLDPTSKKTGLYLTIRPRRSTGIHRGGPKVLEEPIQLNKSSRQEALDELSRQRALRGAPMPQDDTPITIAPSPVPFGEERGGVA